MFLTFGRVCCIVRGRNRHVAVLSPKLTWTSTKSGNMNLRGPRSLAPTRIRHVDQSWRNTQPARIEALHNLHQRNHHIICSRCLLSLSSSSPQLINIYFKQKLIFPYTASLVDFSRLWLGGGSCSSEISPTDPSLFLLLTHPFRPFHWAAGMRRKVGWERMFRDFVSERWKLIFHLNY